MLEIIDLTKRYGPVVALDGASFTARPNSRTRRASVASSYTTRTVVPALRRPLGSAPTRLHSKSRLSLGWQHFGGAADSRHPDEAATGLEYGPPLPQ